MSTQRETMPISAPTATMAKTAFCSIRAMRLGSVAKRGLMIAKSATSRMVATAIALRPRDRARLPPVVPKA